MEYKEILRDLDEIVNKMQFQEEIDFAINELENLFKDEL